ncbi:MAG: DUF2784 domain-containing protein [Xanthomonadales bacterium]|jgi:hypothetical protein|nr:DUF2784 domain-containing protein [Xanthomonadales bacterium]
MAPSTLADLILIVHLAIVAYAVLLPPLVLLGGWRGWAWVRRPGLRLAHLGLIVFVATQALLGELCPLTIWEHELRLAAGQHGYGEQGLIADLLHRVLFKTWSAEAFTVLYVAYALLVLLSFAWVPPRLARNHTAGAQAH